MKSDSLRMLLMFVLVAVILVGSQYLLRPKKTAPPARPAPVQPSPQPESVAAPPRLETLPPTLSPAPKVVQVPESTVTLENGVLRVRFSSIGGAIRSCWFKKYDAEMVPEGSFLLGLTVLSAEPAADLESPSMAVTSTDSSVTFTARAESTTVTRTYVLGPGYTLSGSVSISGPGRGFVLDGRDGVTVDDVNVKEGLAHFHFYAHDGTRLRAVPAAKLKKPQGSSEPADWVGLKSKYFLLAAILKEGTFDSTWAEALPDGRVGFTAVARRPAADFTLYLGPIDYARLRTFGLGLENTAGLGTVKPVALAILWLIRLLYRLFGNWGLAIIVFSIIMKGLFLSLTRSQMKQMKAMQSIQAETEKLKKQYKNDPQGLNKATMDLYSKRGINPLSGCLPMVVQLPVFWALYAVLRNSIELRGAHFVFWLTDLSQPDTLFGHLPTWLPLVSGAAIGLLPILMGVSFIAQTLLTSTDKRNMAMTLIFPVFITFIFLNMPSGLQLYWFMYNVLSLIESKMDDLRVAGYFVLSHLTYPIFLVWARTTGKNRLRRGSVRATFRAGSVRPYVALLYWEQRVKAVLFPERMSMRDRLQRVRETRGRKSGFLGRLGRGLVLLFFGRELKSRQAAGRRRAEPTLVPDDLSRPAALVARLRRPETPLLEHIRSSLTENLRRAIDDHKPGPIPAELRTRLATELNTILESGPLYQPERFARVVLAADTRRLLRQPTGDDLARLNRWLLEDACPQVANSRTSPLAQYRLVTESVKHGATGARLRVRHRRPAAASEAPAPPPQTGDGKPGSP